MAYYKDLGDYLQTLEEHGKLVRIKSRINKDTQMYPLARLQFRGLPEEQRKAFLFENICDSRGRQYGTPAVVGALAGSSEIFAIGMMCKPEEIADKFTQAQLHPIEPEIVEHGPVYEEVHAGDGMLEHGGLDEFPIPICTPGYDVAPYIAAPFWVTKDPQTGIRNLGTYRAQIKAPLRTGANYFSRDQDGYVHWRKCRELGVPQEAAIVIGGPPCIGYVSVFKFPPDTDELAVAGGIAGEPLELVRCQTVNLEVPAHAEVVIEGEINTSMVEPEGPFGELMGYMGLTDFKPYFTVKCIAHRKRPVWLSFISQHPPSESSKFKQYMWTADLYRHLRDDLHMSHVSAVSFHEAGACILLLAIQMKNPEPSQIWPTLEAAANRYPGSRMIVAIDDDVNLQDLEAFSLATWYRMIPHRDCRIMKSQSTTTAPYDPEGQEKTIERSCILIDATRKRPYPPLSLPKKEFMDDALRLWQKEGLPELNLKEPWWGYNLGQWGDEEDKNAALATEGEYYRTGEIYAQRRRAI